MGGPLSAAQIAEFKAEGVVILPDFIDEAQLAQWREQVWDGLPCDPGDPSTWPKQGGHVAVEMKAPLTPLPGELPQFKALIKQLGGGHFTGGGAQIAPIFPNTRPVEWQLPAQGHLDGYNNNWRGVGAHRVCTTFYIQDVVEKGGCFTYWRGGHKKVHEWWRAHPEEVDGRFTATGKYKNGEHAYQGAGINGTQHAVKAGTVCVWHGWCPHNASPNASDQPRLALISRWNDNRFVGDNVRMKYGEPEEPGQVTWDVVTEEMRKHPRYTIPEDLWSDWGADVSGVASAAARL